MAPGPVEPAVSQERILSLHSITEQYDDTLHFYLNGSKVTLESFDPEITLLEYLRGIGLTGTKLGCAEGGCGACTVVISQLNPTTKKIYHASVNACLAPLVSVDGKHVITVEGIGSSSNPHPVQERIARGNGSQCGFCTPGIVMSLYALVRNETSPSQEEVEEAFDGNLCRCTGYRPILDAAQTFSKACGKLNTECAKDCRMNGLYVNNHTSTEATSKRCYCKDARNMEDGVNTKARGGENPGKEGQQSDGSAQSNATSRKGCCQEGQSVNTSGSNNHATNKPELVKEISMPVLKEYDPSTDLIFPPALFRHVFRPLALGNKRKKWYRPVSIQQLLQIKDAYPSAKVIGGSTETQIEIKFKAMRYTASVYVGDIAELRQFTFRDDYLEIGGNVVLTDLEGICLQAMKHYGPQKSQPFQAIYKQIRYFAGRQIRNVGTPAGNLATASPISDLNPVFVATNTVLLARSLSGDTEIPMGQFFKGYRTTALPPDAIIASLRIPTSQERGEYIRAYKQAKRKDDDIAIVNAALRVSLDEALCVSSVDLIYGGMAAYTISAKKTASYLIGRSWRDIGTLEGAMNTLEDDFDIRYGVPGGMAIYRRSLALGFFYRFYHEVLSEIDGEGAKASTGGAQAGSGQAIVRSIHAETDIRRPEAGSRQSADNIGGAAAIDSSQDHAQSELAKLSSGPSGVNSGQSYDQSIQAGLTSCLSNIDMTASQTADVRIEAGSGQPDADSRQSQAGEISRAISSRSAEDEGQRTEVDNDARGEIERNISFGKKDHSVTKAYEKNVLGKANPHVAALKQCTGEAQYTDDIPVQKNELYGALVLSTKPRAKLLNVDETPAMEMPGVITWVSHHDLPDPEANWWGAPNCDEVFFAVNEVFTAGQPIGMILATSARQAEAGARAVIVEYEELPAIFTIEQAISHESFFPHFRYIKKGDVEQAFKKADHVFCGTARVGGQEHFYLETQACVVVPKPEDGEMEIFSSTQNPSETQSYAAQVTGVQANKIVAKVKRLGGGFGGKETRSIQLSAICAVAANKLKRPVRCMLNRDEDMMTSGQRHPFLAHWKVAVNSDGKLQALDADVFCNAGWSQDLSGAVMDRSLSHIDGCYLIPNVHVRGRVAKTNTVSNTAFRGFGGPQGLWIAETYMTEVADRLDMPVERLREVNFYRPNEETHFNQALKDWHVPLMYQQVLDESDYHTRRHAVEQFNRDHKWKKRGLAIIPTKFGISFTALFLNQAGALVHIYHDGSVLVAHGGTEMGQGLHTKMTMIAAEALGVPLANVYVSETATNTVANTSSTAASASSDLNGYAIFNACEQLNERLQPYRERLGPDATMKEIAHAAYFDRVNLSANGFYKTPDIGYVWGPNTGQMFFYFTQGVAAAEVEIDTLTGDWTALRADIKMDVGRSINPSIDYGQIEGAFIQGQGLFTTEESLWNRADGTLFTRGPGTYKIPGFRDIPQEFNVSLLKDVEWENLRTIQRSRGVGEPPLFMGSSVFFAIRDALKAARKQYRENEILSLQSPATPERIRVSCADPIIKRAYVEPREGERSFFMSI